MRVTWIVLFALLALAACADDDRVVVNTPGDGAADTSTVVVPDADDDAVVVDPQDDDAVIMDPDDDDAVIVDPD